MAYSIQKFKVFPTHLVSMARVVKVVFLFHCSLQKKGSPSGRVRGVLEDLVGI